MYVITAYEVSTGELVNTLKAPTGRDLESYAFTAEEHHAAYSEPGTFQVRYSVDGKHRYELVFGAPEQVEIRKGSTVKVVRGRKVAKGTVGVVRWIGEDSYKPGTYRLGLALEGQEKLVYTAESNCELVPVAKPAAAEVEPAAPATRVGAQVEFEGSRVEVFWRGADKYNRGRFRIGIKFANGRKEFVDEGAVKVPGAPKAEFLVETLRPAAGQPTPRSISDIIREVTSYRSSNQ